MALTNDAMNGVRKIAIAVTADGKAPHEDPQGSQAGGTRMWICDVYGNNVETRDLPFSMPVNEGSQMANLRTAPMIEPGTICTVDLLDPKTGFTQITGVLSAVRQPGGSGTGNMAISNMWEKMANVESGINIPPKVEEKNVGGAKVRQIKEKGQKHKYTLLNGLPSHAALFPLAGMHLPGINSIPSAKQASAMVLTDSILSQLPGMSMSLGGMFDMLAGSAFSSIMDALPKELQAGMQSMTSLIQSIEGGTGGGFMTSGRVNPDAFLSNATNLLKGTKNISDLVGTLQRLQSDTSLFGLESLGGISIPIKTPFGEISMSVDAFGNMVPEIPDVVAKAMEGFGSMMSSFSSFPSGSPDIPFFGKMGGQVNSIIQRLPNEAIGKATEQLQKVVAAGTTERSRLNDLTKKAVMAGDVMKNFLG